MKAFKSKMTKYMGPKHSKGDVEKIYRLGKELGTGNFAVVKLATRKDNNDKVAIKIIDKGLCLGKEDMIETEVTSPSRDILCHVHKCSFYQIVSKLRRF